MNYYLLVITLIYVFTLIFLLLTYNKKIKALNDKIKEKDIKYNDLNIMMSKEEFNLVEKYNKNVLLTKVILKKIQKNYTVRQYDKIILIDFYHNLINYTKNEGIIYNIKLGKKYTYKEATNIILKYLSNDKSEKIYNVLSALLYLIFKS